MNLPSIVHRPNPAQPVLVQGHYRGQSLQYAPHSQPYTSRPPAPPPSPPVEDNSKCSLPSISTLLVYADGQNQSHDRQQSQSSRVSLPPTPPMRPESVFEGGNSPVMAAGSPSSYYFPNTAYGTGHPHRNSYPPAQKVYPSPTESTYSAQQGYYSQDSYGKSPQLLVPVSVAPPSSANPWHHHHHQSPSSQAQYPQSQDRYICTTCNKAFSRPSSLRIHSHSHTGEKPFKCPHHGCGKAFSVRSNMKRHERGCHQ